MISKTFRLPDGDSKFELDLIDRLNAIFKEIVDATNNLEDTAVKPPTSIVNYYSDGSISHDLAYLKYQAKSILSGALTADTWKEVLSITDSGIIHFLGVMTEDATSRTLGLKVVIDSVTVFEAVSGAISNTSDGVLAIGSYMNDAGAPGYVPFNTSLSVSIKSSLSETDKVRLVADYYLT